MIRRMLRIVRAVAFCMGPLAGVAAAQATPGQFTPRLAVRSKVLFIFADDRGESDLSHIRADGPSLIRDRGESKRHLYNLNKNQTAVQDLIKAEPDHAATMRATWDGWAKENNVLPTPCFSFAGWASAHRLGGTAG